MARTAHAIQIETDDGTGNPLSYTNTAIGISSGVFYLITERFGLDGTKTIAGDSSRTTWYEGILTKEYSSFSPSRTADFVESGDVSAASSFSFSIKNTASFWSTLESNSVYLARCRVTYFHISSTDGITFTFAKRWTGVIDEVVFSETSFVIRCIDNSKDIFSTTPSKQVDSSTFPSAIKESLGKTIPIAIGRVAYSPLVNVSSQQDRVQLNSDSGSPRYVVAGENYTVANWQAGHAYVVGDRVLPVSITAAEGFIYTATVAGTSGGSEPAFPNQSGATVTDGGVTWVASSARALDLKCTILFTDNDYRLVGKYVSVVYGEEKQSRKILSNEATNATTGLTRVMLEYGFSGTPVDWESGSTDSDVWYYDVRTFSASLLASEKPIYAYQDNAQGISALYFWQTEEKQYADISEISVEKSLSNVAFLGYPGLKITAKSADLEGNLEVFFKIPPRHVTGENYTDADDATYTDLVFDSALETQGVTINFRSELFAKSYEKIFVLFDFSHARSGAASNPQLDLTVQLFDLHGRTINTSVSTTSIHNITVSGSGVFSDKYLLPGLYFGEVRDDSNFYAFKDRLDLSDVLNGTKDNLFINAIRLIFRAINGSAGNTYTLRLREVGFIGQKSINITTEAVYGSLIGEVFGTRWRSPDAPSTNRKTSTDPILLIGDALEHLIRNYDYNHPVWVASQAVVVGEKRRPTVDNGFIYICTVAGTTHASVEPTWPTTLTSTVTDGTVTWKALDTLKIHCGSFDTIASQRFNWYVGRTLTEKRPSLDYYRELARHGFLGLFVDTQGRVKVKSWVDNRTPSVTFSSSNILQGTLGEITLTPLRRVYNDFTIRYDWNPASGNFNKQIVVTRVDEPAFPGASDLLTPGTALGGTFQVFRLSDGSGGYRFYFVCSATHGLTSGNYVSLSGNTSGFDFSPSQVSVVNAWEFYVAGFITTSVFSTSGTIRTHTDTRIKWKAFVGGVQSYGSAKGLWEQCHASYIVSKSVQKLPSELGDCHWFIDPDATDPSGNSIWTDLTGAGDEHPAFYYAMRLADWVTWQKKQTSFEVANDSTNQALELYDPVYLNDAKLTGGVNKLGWIHEITDLPGDDRLPDRIRIGVTFNPDQLASCDFLFDTQGAADTLTDTQGAADTVTDTQC